MRDNPDNLVARTAESVPVFVCGQRLAGKPACSLTPVQARGLVKAGVASWANRGRAVRLLVEPQDARMVLTKEQVGTALQMSLRSVERLVERGALRAVYLPGSKHPRFLREAIGELLVKCEQTRQMAV